jgi:hypothetical protein
MKMTKDFRMRMREKRAKMKGKREFKEAAIVFIVLKVFIIALTYMYISCSGCENKQLIRQLFHLVLGSHFVYAGMRITSSIIGIVSLFRGTTYIVNFFFKKTFLMTLPLTHMQLSVLKDEWAGNWFFLINGVILFIVAGMIWRAVRLTFKSKDTAVETITELPSGNLSAAKQ